MNAKRIRKKNRDAVIADLRSCKARLRISVPKGIQPGHMITMLMCQQDQLRFPSVLFKYLKQPLIFSRIDHDTFILFRKYIAITLCEGIC